MTRLTHYTAWLAIPLLWLLLTPTAFSAETITVKSPAQRTAVVELYTSEGCSSCPPADQWLKQLIQLPSDELDVLALAFHVDYWDYIGWKDRFASPAYSNRQRHLGRLNQQRSIYTPEFFVDGRETRGTRNIIKRAGEINRQTSPVDLTLQITPESEQISLQLSSQPKTGHGQPYVVRFLVFENQLSSRVNDGENAGRQLVHERVVRYFTNPQVLTAQMQHQIRIDPQWNPGNLGVGVLIQTPKGEYLQAVYSLLRP